MNYLDLFAGIGGFALGAHWAGMKFEKHYFSEIDEYACKIYQKRFPEAINLGDITKIKTEDLPDGEWIITGGFPCQDISIAGRGDGITGSRSGLWFEYWRLIRDLRPQFAIVENVGMLVRRGLREVLRSLAEIGYNAEWQDIRASDLGAPHRRERIWIVAYTGHLCRRNKKQGAIRERKKNRMQCDTVTGSSKTWDVADTDLSGCEREGEKSKSTGEIGIGDTSTQKADTDNKRLQGHWRLQECTGKMSPWACCRTHEDEWLTRSGIRRISTRISNRVDRLKCLGNSIVPQIAELLFRRIKELI